MSIVAHQGEESTDSASRSDNFLSKHYVEGALKARQLHPGLFSAHARCSGNFADRRAVRTRHQNLTGRFPVCQAHFNAINNHSNRYLM